MFCLIDPNPISVTLTILEIGLLDGVGGPLGCSDWPARLSWWAWLAGRRMSARSAVVVCPGGVRIMYIRLTASSSLDAAPVTESLLFYAPVCYLAICCAAECSSWIVLQRREAGLASRLVLSWSFPGTLRRLWLWLWYGCSKTWMQCVRRPRNGSVIPGRGSVPTVTNGLNATCIVMWLPINWTWPSCGGARCPGARCGRARTGLHGSCSGGA